jgi:hypothetical protein
MTRSNDSRPPHRSSGYFATAALVLLATGGWSRHARAGGPSSAGAEAPQRLAAGAIRTLLIDPEIATTLYAATSCSGVLKSLDGGDSWHRASAGQPSNGIGALAIDPMTPATLYAAARIWPGGIFESTDGTNT